MRIIFSRKGFDSGSGSGGAPSPILPDGSMLSLPIPDGKSKVTYQDITWGKYNLGEIAESITKGKVKSGHGAHLDPDVDRTTVSVDLNAVKRCAPDADVSAYRKNWQPIFGQIKAAQGHLRKQGVCAGDLFLFFGLFQDAVFENGAVKLDKKAPRRHIIWGWQQVEEIHPADGIDKKRFKWALYHPHLHRRNSHPSNTLYIARKTLDIPGLAKKNIGGAGIFPKYSANLQLTAPGDQLKEWRLPLWMHPKEETSYFSYHGELKRWKKQKDCTLLETVARGQEFVFNAGECGCVKEASAWLNSLFAE